MPIYTPKAIRLISRHLNPQSKVFEFGSGRSSIWYSKRVGEYFAAEHDELWFKSVSEELIRSYINNAKLIFCPNVDGFQAYTRSIDTFPNDYFDLISIDGRARVKCASLALSKLRNDGILLLDDSARPKYAAIFHMLTEDGFVQKRCDFGMRQTTIFQRSTT